jgi:hypothetical protein
MSQSRIAAASNRDLTAKTPASATLQAFLVADDGGY